MRRTSTIDRKSARAPRQRRSPVGSPRARSDHQSVLDLQRTAGNRATTLLIQRVGRSGAEKQLADDIVARIRRLVPVLTKLKSLPDPKVGESADTIADQLLTIVDLTRDEDSDVDLCSADMALDRICLDIEVQARKLARQAHAAHDDASRDTLIEVSNDAATIAEMASVSLGTGDPHDRPGRLGQKDTAAAAGGVAGSGNDVVGGLGGGIASIADVATGASSTGVAVFGGVAGGFGILFGLIGAGLGVYAGDRGRTVELRLKALAESGVISDDQVKDLNAYAQEKKRKKKWGGVITSTVGAAGIGAGVIGLIALSVATLGVAAIVAGIGAALIGLGVVLGRWIHKKIKRSKFEAKIPGLAAQLLEDGKGGNEAVRRQVAAMGVTIAWNDDNDIRAKLPSVASALRDRISSRRDFVALSLLGYLTGPASTAQFDAEEVVEALGLDPDALRELVAADDAPTAQARIADKMASW